MLCRNCSKRPTCYQLCSPAEEFVNQDEVKQKELTISEHTNDDIGFNNMLSEATCPWKETIWNYDYWLVTTSGMKQRDGDVVFDFFVLGYSVIDLMIKYHRSERTIYRILSKVK